MKKNNIWIVVALCGLSCASVGTIINSAGVFFTPVAEALNLKRGTLAFCATIISVGSSLVSIFLLKKLNNKNFRKTLLFCAIVCSVSLALMALANTIIEFFLLSALVASSMACFNMTAISILINNNIKENVGSMTGFIFSFCGVMGALVSPLLTNIIEVSYKTAYIVEGLIVFICCLPSILVKMDYSPKEVNNEKHDYSLPLLIIMCLLNASFCVVSAYPQHFLGLAATRGFQANQCALLLSGSMIGNIVFKLIFGKVSDKIGPAYSIIVVLVLNIIGNLIVSTSSSLVMLIFGSFMFGANYCITSVLNSLLSQRLFKDSFNDVYPIVQFIGNVGQGISLTAVGYIYDFTNTYTIASIIMAILSILNIVVVYLIRKK